MDKGIKDSYRAIPKDNTGSLVSSRFTYQRYWAIREAYRLYNNKEEFCLVLEGAEDIDILKEDGIHFYQVKTKENVVHYTLNTMIYKNRETGKSIISKLSEKEPYPNVTSLNIVTNRTIEERFCVDDVNYCDNCICFSKLNSDFNNIIKNHIYEVTGRYPDLNKYFYIYSDLALTNMKETMVGLTLTFLKNQKTSDERVEMFFNYIDSVTKEKMEKTTCTNVLEEKSIDNAFFDELLSEYDTTSNYIVSECNKIISEYPTVVQNRLQRSLSNMNNQSFATILIKSKIEKVVKFIRENEESLADKSNKELCDYLLDKLCIEGAINQEEKLCYIIVGVVHYLHGGNENE